MYIILVILLLLIAKLSYNKKQYKLDSTSKTFRKRYINSNLNYLYVRPNSKKRYNSTYRSYPLYVGEHKYYSFIS